MQRRTNYDYKQRETRLPYREKKFKNDFIVKLILEIQIGVNMTAAPVDKIFVIMNGLEAMITKKLWAAMDLI